MSKPFFKVGERVKLSKMYLDTISPELKLRWAPMVGKTMQPIKKEKDGYIYYCVKFNKALSPEGHKYFPKIAECYLRRV